MSNKIKERLPESPDKQFKLTEYETALLRELTILLQFHIAKDKILTNIMTYIAMGRLGYGQIRKGYALSFNLDLDTNPGTVAISEVKL